MLIKNAKRWEFGSKFENKEEDNQQTIGAQIQPLECVHKRDVCKNRLK